jgi:lipoate-protein ligase B
MMSGASCWAVCFDRPVPYAEGLEWQEALHAARLADAVPDTVLFLEHRPVVTLGSRGRGNFLNATPEELAARGVDFARASRGGDVTYHAPGQLVMYPILKLGSREQDAHGYLRNLEEIAIRTAGAFGVAARRREGMNGAWTDAGKIAAIGFRLKRWVTLHGMSFNVDLDLEGFKLIVPCGLVGQPVASLKQILGDKAPSLQEARKAMAGNFEIVCGRPLENKGPDEIQILLGKFKICIPPRPGSLRQGGSAPTLRLQIGATDDRGQGLSPPT